MNIQDYTGFFHDGYIDAIEHGGDTIIVAMESAEMDDDEIDAIQDDLILSEEDNIRGKLHIEGVKSIIENDEPFLGVLTKKYEDPEIFDFEMTEHTVKLTIEWCSYSRESPSVPLEDHWSIIEIEAEKIWWENIPDLPSNSKDDAYLDVDGNPVSKKSLASRLYSPGSVYWKENEDR